MAEGDKRRHGYSRDKRPDCPQVVIALVVTPDGLPLAYEVLPGNTADCTTLRMFLARIERQYGPARRVWVMDRGIPTEAVLAESAAATRRCSIWWERRKAASRGLRSNSWPSFGRQARPGVQVKLLAENDELYVYAESVGRVSKERVMRKRQLKWLWKRLRELVAMEVPREEMLMKLGAARARGTPTSDPTAQAQFAASASTADRSRPAAQSPAVVKTFSDNPLVNNGRGIKNCRNPRRRAKAAHPVMTGLRYPVPWRSAHR